MRVNQIHLRISLLFLGLVFAQGAQASDDLIGHWLITSPNFISPVFPAAKYEISIEKGEEGYSAWVYNGPLDISVDGDNFEITLDWVDATDTVYYSKLIGSLKDKDHIVGEFKEPTKRNFYGVPLPNGPFEGIRIAGSVVNKTVEDLPPSPTDISGLWRGGGSSGFRKEKFAFTEKGHKINKNFKNMDAPHIRCAGYGMLTSMRLSPMFGLEIFQAENQITMIIGADYIRRIYLDDRELKDTEPDTYMGFSRGEWKGDTLVVTTTHLAPTFITAGHGSPVSENTRVIEYFRLDENGYLRGDMWIDDPENYIRFPYLESSWDKNFTEPAITKIGCDAYSFYRQLHSEGELEEFFSRAEYRR